MERPNLSGLIKRYCPPDINNENGERVLLYAAVLIHGLLLLYGALNGFGSFLNGDRSWLRYEAMKEIMAVPIWHWPSKAVWGLVGPGEYLLQIPAYLLAKETGIIILHTSLTIMSVVCLSRMAGQLLKWRKAGFITGLIYLLTPQSLVYPHQLVTEAISTPFICFFIFFFYKFIRNNHKPYAIYAGICLGFAAFVRPSLILIIPALISLFLLFKVNRERNFLVGIGLACTIALLPLLLWSLIFTATTGNFGYTSGVATLNWNLRSKVFLVQKAYDLEKSPEIEHIKTYHELYEQPQGISAGRFLEISARTPWPFIKTAFLDAYLVFGRGNSTKLTVDFLNLSQDKDVKSWRQILTEGGFPKLAGWAIASMDLLFVFTVEIIATIVTTPIMIAAFGISMFSLMKARNVTTVLGESQHRFILLIVAVIFTVLINAEMVDLAQARLRHPAEAGIILIIGLAIQYMKITMPFADRRWATLRSLFPMKSK